MTLNVCIANADNGATCMRGDNIWPEKKFQLTSSFSFANSKKKPEQSYSMTKN